MTNIFSSQLQPQAQTDLKKKKEQTNQIQQTFSLSVYIFPKILCGLTGGQTEGAAGCRQPGWTPREPHGHCGYGLRPGKHQPAEFHRYTRG